MRRTANPSGAISSLIIVITLTAGCQSAMSNHANSPGSSSPARGPNVFPLRFVNHSFEAHCYNTLRCQVLYNNHNFSPWKADQPSGPPRSPDYREHWGLASYIGVRNFPPPAQVRWTSLDGVAHEAEVDIGAIFKDERVLLRVPESEIPEGLFPQGLVSGTSIHLEVNDRTISVFMLELIPTKAEQTPGNKNSYGRDDLILAWTHTY